MVPVWHFSQLNVGGKSGSPNCESNESTIFLGIYSVQPQFLWELMYWIIFILNMKV